MSIADIGRAFSIGTLVLLALGVLLWAVLKLRNEGMSIVPILAMAVAAVLMLIAVNFFMAGMTFGY